MASRASNPEPLVSSCVGCPCRFSQFNDYDCHANGIAGSFLDDSWPATGEDQKRMQYQGCWYATPSRKDAQSVGGEDHHRK
jgi:hypothetical protein